MFTYSFTASAEVVELLASVSLDCDLQIPYALEVLLSRKSSKCKNGIPAATSFQDFTVM